MVQLEAKSNLALMSVFITLRYLNMSIYLQNQESLLAKTVPYFFLSLSVSIMPCKKGVLVEFESI